MTLRSPVAAMVWENWRLTRAETAQRLVQGIVLVAAVLAGVAAFGSVGNKTARLALFLLSLTYMPMWISVARLNGGRMMDGYRPGYPFYVLYTRPVRTFVLVGAPMAYLVTLTVAGYVASALVLRAVFGYPFPVLPMAACIAAFHIAQWAAQWGTGNKGVQWLGSIAAGLGFSALAAWRLREWPARVDFSIGDYVLMTTVAVTCFGLAVAGVARQRRGDAKGAISGTVTRSGFSDWIAGLFRFPCPTTSAMRAQVWFDLKSSGLAVLAIGLALALVIPLLVVVTSQIDVGLSWFRARPASLAGPASLTVGVLAMFFLPAVLIFGGNAFGIRARQGWAYASAFEVTQACGTARMAGLKVLVRSVCLLAALVAVGVSLWASLSFIAVSEAGAPLRAYEPMRSWRRAIERTGGAMSAYELLALAFVIVMVVAVFVASRAALAALRARYRRRVKIATWSLLLHGLVLVLLALAAQRGIGVKALSDGLSSATPWVAAAAMGLATVYLFWRALAERLLTPGSTCVAVVVSAAFGAAWVTVLTATGVQLAEVPTASAVWMLSPALLPLMASALAPWSLSRVRHT